MFKSNRSLILFTAETHPRTHSACSRWFFLGPSLAVRYDVSLTNSTRRSTRDGCDFHVSNVRQDRIAQERYSGRSEDPLDRKSTRLNSSHLGISYAVFC